MVSRREFWMDCIGSAVGLLALSGFVGYFLIAYVPTLGTQAISQQITIIVAAVGSACYTLAILAMFIASLVNERPRGTDQ
jgi:hypothetical protein